MKSRVKKLFLCSLLAFFASPAAYALDVSIDRINAVGARALLGDGTDVVIGIIDSGIDHLHPMLAGTDSLGRPRMVAADNFVTTESTNTGMDVFGHGTAVAGVALGVDPLGNYTGIATDARFINARGLDSRNSFNSYDWLINAGGFAQAQGADVINMSLNLFGGNLSGNTPLSQLADYLSYEHNLPVVVSSGNTGARSGTGHLPRGPGDAFNVISVASALGNGYTQVVSTSSYGPTSDGRIKPDVTAPGDKITTADDDWETGADYRQWNGTSFAAPHITGLIATQIDYGRANQLSTHALVIKSTVLNSTEKIEDRIGDNWAPNATSIVDGIPSSTSPYDNQSGTGLIDGLKLARQYMAGEFSPGTVEGVGWDLNTIQGVETIDYVIEGSPEIGSFIDVSLAWHRHVGLVDNNNNDIMDGGDRFQILESLDNLDLMLLLDGVPITQSISTVDNVEHLHWEVMAAGEYSIRVSRKEVFNSGNDELYALAWSSTTAIPEPGSLVVLGVVMAGMCGRRSRG